MKFIADVMLGSLARRLRLLGFDVLYGRTLADNDLIQLALEQDRVILTRDTGLAARPLAKNHYLITTDDIDGQVRQVVESLALPADRALTRCSLCNRPLVPLGRPDARERVPEYVSHRMEQFFHCEGCGRVYWKGTHVKNMERKGAIKKPVPPGTG